MSILDKLNKLIVGTSELDLSKTKRALDQLKTVNTTNDFYNFSELVKSLFSDNQTNSRDSNNNLYSSFVDLAKDLGIQLSDINPENDRIARYKEYEGIVKKIPYMKRALKVITQNILNPEDYTKKAIQISYEGVYDKDSDISFIMQYVQNLIDTLELEDFIFDIVYNTLKYGDYFIEIVVLPEILKQYKILNENYNPVKQQVISEQFRFGEDSIGQIDVVIDYSNLALSESVGTINSSEKKKGLNKLKTSDLYLNFLSPEYVVKLGDRFCLGYLVFQNIQQSNMLKSTNTTMQNITAQKDVIKTLAKKIMQKISTLDKTKQTLLKTETDLQNTLARFLATYVGPETSNGNIQLNARFIPPELMEHFTINVSEFKPYGTSIFYGSEFLAKIVVAIQSSIMIQRLTRAVEKRLIRVDLGISRDARRYLTEVKTLLNRRKFTVDNLGTVDEIPSNLSTFEDIYIPIKNGKSPVEFETLPPVGELSTRVDDLKQLRDNLVASVDVPPPYLGIEENTESKAQLSQENVVFATTIINNQKQISKHLTSLLQKVVKLLNVNKQQAMLLQDIKLVFEPPTSVIMEHKSEYLQNVSNIIEQLSSLGIPKTYLINKLIPQFKNWEVEEADISEKLEKLYKQSNTGSNGETLGGEETGGGGFEF